jgi:enterochelin esterase-like enzyme
MRWWTLTRRGLMAVLGGLPSRTGDRVTVERLPPLESRILGERRTIDVYLPRQYADDATRHYPVLYANDGQDMEAVDLAGILDSLQRSGQMAPILVVAIHATQRVQDYGTAGVLNAQGLGARATTYQRFVVEELMPLIAARYRADSSRAGTALMGWSLGGLSAFDLAWNHPDRFGMVGVFSGSFWWRTSDQSASAKQASRIVHRRVHETTNAPSLRLWFETGLRDEADDRDSNGVIDAIQDTEELVRELQRLGYRSGPDLVHLTVDGQHDLATWKQVLPQWLTWAYPSHQAPAGPAD